MKYKLLLENLRKSEADYQDDAKIVFLVQVRSERTLLIMETNGFDYNFSFGLCMLLRIGLKATKLLPVMWDVPHIKKKHLSS